MAARWAHIGRLSQNFLRFRWESGFGSPFGQLRYLHRSCTLYDASKITMPALSPTMVEGTIVKWHKKEGEKIIPGDVICEIQTDKAVLSLDVEEEGILAKILKPDDTKNVAVGTPIAILVEEGDDWENVEIPPEEVLAVTPDTGPESPGEAPKLTTTLGYGPAVRSLLDIYNLKADQIQASGPHGRLLKGDILRYINEKNLKPADISMPPPPAPPAKEAAAAPPPPASVLSVPQAAPIGQTGPPPPAFESGGFTDADISSMRKTIAKRLTESKMTIPHAYSQIDCKMDSILSLRKTLAEEGVKVSVNDFIIKACAVALQRVPTVNACIEGDSIKMMNAVDISVAVATPNGLITPIVKDAAGLGLQTISATIKDLAGRAREGKLQLHEFQGGSFTISNLGMFGISHFTAIINPPQACILAIGASRLVPGGTPESSPETHMTVQLSSDARIVDDLLASQFLEVFKDIIENPMLMLGSTGPKDLHVNEDEENVAVDRNILFAK